MRMPVEQIVTRDRRDDDAALRRAESAALVTIDAGGLRALSADAAWLAGSLERRAGPGDTAEIPLETLISVNVPLPLLR